METITIKVSPVWKQRKQNFRLVAGDFSFGMCHPRISLPDGIPVKDEFIGYFGAGNSSQQERFKTMRHAQNWVEAKTKLWLKSFSN